MGSCRTTIVWNGSAQKLIATAAPVAVFESEEAVRAAHHIGTEGHAGLVGQIGDADLRGANEEECSAVGIGILVTARVGVRREVHNQGDDERGSEWHGSSSAGRGDNNAGRDGVGNLFALSASCSKVVYTMLCAQTLVALQKIMVVNHFSCWLVRLLLRIHC